MFYLKTNVVEWSYKLLDQSKIMTALYVSMLEGPERATRSRSRTTVVLDSVKAAAPPHLRSVSSSSGEMSKMFDFSHSGMKKVNLKRGSESLFAPADFWFTAPENVKPFSFSKLNSSNEASDIERKMAMIEISTDDPIFSSGGGGASSAKQQTRKSTKITCVVLLLLLINS